MTVLHNMEPSGVMGSLLRLMHNEARLIELLSYNMLLMAVFVLIMLQFYKAAYGRYTSNSWGFLIGGRLCWFLQELPSFLIPAYYYFRSDLSELTSQPANKALLMMFLMHYANRTFIFTYLIRGGKPTPVLVFLFALVFCIYNGYMQGCYLAKFAHYPVDWSSSPQFICGVAIFFSGMVINIHSDRVLRNLRKPGETAYKIPKGGFFQFVSGANFFGEIVEWAGFALASWSLPALAFAIFTAANIGPRALAHHKWYLDKFGSDYPRNRKAVIPGIL